MRVLDLTRLFPGPYATLVLSDLGADVVKVEDPRQGDYLREISVAMYEALNRGKRSIALDLKSPGDVETLRRLCASADVLVESFRPGVLARLGLGDLADRFPRLVVASLSGYGQTGPWSERAGHDITYLALSGALARCGLGDVPVLPGIQTADFAGAFSTVIAVLAALLERQRTGRGRSVEVAIVEAAMQMLLPLFGELSKGARPAARGEDLLSGSRPAYRVYRCKGGGAYALGALEPKFWARFCEAVERPEWQGRLFDISLTPQVDELFLQRTREEWDALLRPFDCCGERVLEPYEAATHPQVRARGLFLASGVPRTQPALGAPGARPAPARGEHTEEVLREWLAPREAAP